MILSIRVPSRSLYCFSSISWSCSLPGNPVGKPTLMIGGFQSSFTHFSHPAMSWVAGCLVLCLGV